MEVRRGIWDDRQLLSKTLQIKVENRYTVSILYYSKKNPFFFTTFSHYVCLELWIFLFDLLCVLEL